MAQGAAVYPTSVDTALHQLDPAAHPKVVKTIAASSTAQTLDMSLNDAFDITLTGNLVITISNPPPAGDLHTVDIRFRQDATHGRTVTWPASVKWAGGSAPTITATALGSTDLVKLSTWDGGTTWYGSIAQDLK